MPAEPLRFAMPVGTWNGPIPVPDLESEGYWKGLREHEFRVLRCQNCGHWTHPPLAACPNCHSFELEYERVAGSGTLYSFTVVHREFVPGIEPPYVAALVELQEQPGLRILTNLVNCEESDLQIGLAVHAVFHDIAEGTTVVFFEPDVEAVVTDAPSQN